MKNLRIEPTYRTRVAVSWDTDTERCHVWLVGPKRPDGVQNSDPFKLDNRYHVNPPQRADGTFPKFGDPDYFPHRTRDIYAKSNLKDLERIKALIAATDIPALIAARQAEEDAKLDGQMRQARIEALKHAVLLIRMSDGDELAAAVLDEEVVVARWATALRETGAGL